MAREARPARARSNSGHPVTSKHAPAGRVYIPYTHGMAFDFFNTCPDTGLYEGEGGGTYLESDLVFAVYFLVVFLDGVFFSAGLSSSVAWTSVTVAFSMIWSITFCSRICR